MRFVIICLIPFVFGCAADAVGDPPAPLPQNMPGEVLGQIQTRWLAPYVSLTERRVGEGSFTSVVWLTPQGTIRREVSGPQVITNGEGWVEEIRDGQVKIFGVSDDWELTLPRKSQNLGGGYITGTHDSRMFMQSFQPAEGRISADFYISGKLVSSVGPFLQYQGRDFQLGDDGSAAVLAWKSPARDIPQVIVFGSGGKETFRADCDGPVDSPAPAPDGAAVLVQTNDGGDALSLYTKAGKASSKDLGSNARFIAWMPGTTTALMETSIGHSHRWSLVDWRTQTTLWDVADPANKRADWGAIDFAVTSDYVLIAGTEYASTIPVRSVYALNAKNGTVAAHWTPNYASYPIIGQSTFLQSGGHIFLVTDSECSEIKMDEIAAHVGGWK